MNFQCNCSIIGDPQSRKAILIDPGGDSEMLSRRISELDVQIKIIVHTHAHLDHFLASGKMKIFASNPEHEKAEESINLVYDDEKLEMGFNNLGVDHLVEQVKVAQTDAVIGINIGKNIDTPVENAVDDYITCFNELFPYVDYFVVNVSSPNTPNLRELQDKKPLTNILNRLQQENTKKEVRKPILLKIAPDLSFEQLDDIIDIVAETKIDGIIATNTTIQRSGLKTPKDEIEKIGNGGLSGRPLLKRSTEVIQYLKQKSQNAFTVIGVGGITKPEDALEKINAGADLVQVYTGFVYEGPALIKKINKLLLENFEQNENN